MKVELQTSQLDIDKEVKKEIKKLKQQLSNAKYKNEELVKQIKRLESENYRLEQALYCYREIKSKLKDFLGLEDSNE